MPAPGVRVSIQGDPDSPQSLYSGATTDGDGLASVRLPAGRRYLFRVGGQAVGAGGLAAALPREDPSQPLLLVLRGFVPCAGRIELPGDYGALGGEWRLDFIGIEPWGESWLAGTAVDPAELAFAVEGVPPGECRAVLHTTGARREALFARIELGRARFELPPGGSTELVLKLEPAE